MGVVTLTSDWNRHDHYLGAIKGYILSRCPGTTIVDITHQVHTFNIAEAAFIVKNSYNNFPEGTVHIIGVKSEPGEENPFVVVGNDGHWFIGTDNGLFGLIFEERPDRIVRINSAESGSFPELNIFSEAACHILNGGDVTDLGEEKEKLFRQVPLMPTIEESVINGSIIYIDSYNNAITNIGRELFEQVGKNRVYDIFIHSNHYKINRINKKYQETESGEILALFNSLDLLEIAMKDGNAAEMLGLDTKSTIRIKFYDNKDS